MAVWEEISSLMSLKKGFKWVQSLGEEVSHQISVTIKEGKYAKAGRQTNIAADAYTDLVCDNWPGFTAAAWTDVCIFQPNAQI